MFRADRHGSFLLPEVLQTPRSCPARSPPRHLLSFSGTPQDHPGTVTARLREHPYVPRQELARQHWGRHSNCPLDRAQHRVVHRGLSGDLVSLSVGSGLHLSARFQRPSDFDRDLPHTPLLIHGHFLHYCCTG